MSPAEQAPDRIYTRPPHFSVHLRAGRRLRWSGAARTDYAALLLLGGRMRWRAAGPEAWAEADATSKAAAGTSDSADALTTSAAAATASASSPTAAASSTPAASGETG